MKRSKEYQQLLNSKRWKELRRWKLQRNPLCEICASHGYVRAAVDVHHIVPVESARDNMENLCFSPANLQALCVPCHMEVHKTMRSQTRENHQQTARNQVQRWLDRHKNGLQDTTRETAVDTAAED